MADVTPARLRALLKAERNGFIMRPGGFCEENPLMQSAAIESSNFDTRSVIDDLFDVGMLTFGDGSNQFVLTDAGRQAVAAHHQKTTKRQRGAEARVAA